MRHTPPGHNGHNGHDFPIERLCDSREGVIGKNTSILSTPSQTGVSGSVRRPGPKRERTRIAFTIDCPESHPALAHITRHVLKFALRSFNLRVLACRIEEVANAE